MQQIQTLLQRMLGGYFHLSKPLTPEQALKLYKANRLIPVIEAPQTHDNGLTVCEAKTPTLNDAKKPISETVPTIPIYQPKQKAPMTEEQKSLTQEIIGRLNNFEKLW